MRKLIVFICFQFAIIKISTGQDTTISVPSGIAEEDPVFLKQYVAKGSFSPIVVSSGQKKLPTPLDNYLPRVLDQGQQGACTAFTVAEALSIRDNYLARNVRSSGRPQVLYSPTYLWVIGKRKSIHNDNCHKYGISYSTAFSCLFKYGIVEWSKFPFMLDNIQLCHSSLPSSISANVLRNKEFVYEDVILNINSFKNLLRQGYPICIATNLDLNYHNVLNDGSGLWIVKGTPTKEQHAMLIVDFDDDRKLFKVLNSYGETRGDKGIIWLSYDLVNRNLDKGVVFGCYIVSLQNELTSGPVKDVSITSSGFGKSDLKYIDSAFVGRIADDNGNGIAGATITIKGNPLGTMTDNDGNFKIVASPDATLELSSIGFSKSELKSWYRSEKKYNNNKHITWTKEGYYRIFNSIRFGIIELDRHNKRCIVSLKDDNTGKLITASIELLQDAPIEISINDLSFTLKLTDIRHAGNVFNMRNWYAAYIEYSLKSDTATLTQYF